MGVEREEGLWWARYSGGEWVGLCVDCKSAIIGDVFFELDDPEIEWGPYLGKGPLGSMEGLVAWLVGHTDVEVEDIARNLVLSQDGPERTPGRPVALAEFDAVLRRLYQSDAGPGSPDRHPLDSAGTPASPQGLKGATQLDGAPGSFNRHMEAVESMCRGRPMPNRFPMSPYEIIEGIQALKKEGHDDLAQQLIDAMPRADTSGMGKAHVRAVEEAYGVTLPVAAKVPRGTEGGDADGIVRSLRAKYKAARAEAEAIGCGSDEAIYGLAVSAVLDIEALVDLGVLSDVSELAALLEGGADGD